MEKQTEICCSRCKRWVSEYYDYGALKFCLSCDDPENSRLAQQEREEAKDILKEAGVWL